MTDLEERLRVALHDRAESVREADLRPEELPSASFSARRDTLKGLRSHRGWLLPIGVAAAIVAILVAVTVIRPGTQHGAPHITGRPTVTTSNPTTAHQTAPSTGTPTSVQLLHAPLAVVRARASDLHEHGRRFDVGKLMGWNGKPGNRMVLYLKRLTVAGVPDSQVASHGLRLTAHTDMPYVGIGRTRYAISVVSGTRFIYNACTSGKNPDDMVLKRVHLSAAEFVSHVGYVTGFEVKLNRQGEATEVQTDGGC